MESIADLHFARVDEEHVDLLLGFIDRYYELDHIEFERGAARRAVGELLAAPALGAAWLIRRDGRWLGYFVLAFGIDLEFGGKQATLTEIFVAEDSRRAGIGRASLRFIEQELMARRIHALELQVEEHNAAARAFYERLGFEAPTRIPLSRRINLD